METAIDDPELMLVRAFGLSGARIIFQIMKKGKLEEVFGSSAEVIRQIASGKHPSVKDYGGRRRRGRLSKVKVRYFLGDER